jgi:RNA helicase HrpA
VIHGRDLPVWDLKDALVQAVRDNPVVVVEGPTGCGKSTQIPQILWEGGVAPRGRIGVTQPRRIACLSVAYKIAQDLKCDVGGLVGYKMRFQDCTDRDTRLKVMTDGILIQEMQADPDLNQYDVLMIDEAHERSLNIDIILGLLKRLLARRRDLRVLVSSATIEPARFQAFFNGAPLVSVGVRTHPVRVIHKDLKDPDLGELVDRSVEEALRIVTSNRPGDILIFLTGEDDIKRCVAKLEPMTRGRAVLFPLYSRLSREEQERVFDDLGARKIVVATNIAETSVTLDGVDWVIDCGLAKFNEFNPETLISSLVQRPISQASSAQRAGRTGRTGPGTCIRLYSEVELHRRPPFSTPEIVRSDLSEVVLRLLDLRIRDVEDFEFLTPPAREAIARTLARLQFLDAVTPNRELTPLGRRMVQFPLEPVLSRIILEALERYPDVVDEAIICCAFLSTRHPFLLPMGEEAEARRAHQRFADPEGDFVSYVRLLRTFVGQRDPEAFCERNYLDLRMLTEIVNVVDQLREIVTDLGGVVKKGGSNAALLKALCTGLRENLCRRGRGKDYETLREGNIFIHPGSLLIGHRPAFMVCGEIVTTSRCFARSCSPISGKWLREVSPVHAQRWLGARPSMPHPGRGLELRVGADVVSLAPTRKGRRALVDLEFAQRLAREVDRGEVLRLGRLRVDLRANGTFLFQGEPLLDVVDFLRALKAAPVVRRAPRLHDLMNPFDDRGAVERFAEDAPRFGTVGRGRGRAGLVTLARGENDLFWLDLVGNPHESLNTSLDALRAWIELARREFHEEPAEVVLRAEERLAAIIDRMTAV